MASAAAKRCRGHLTCRQLVQHLRGRPRHRQCRVVEACGLGDRPRAAPPGGRPPAAAAREPGVRAKASLDQPRRIGEAVPQAQRPQQALHRRLVLRRRPCQCRPPAGLRPRRSGAAPAAAGQAPCRAPPGSPVVRCARCSTASASSGRPSRASSRARRSGRGSSPLGAALPVAVVTGMARTCSRSGSAPARPAGRCRGSGRRAGP